MYDKRVCIVTNYSTTTNFGALLQAYALNKTVNDMGYKAEDLYVVGDYSSKKKKLIRQISQFKFKEIKNEVVGRIQKYRVRDTLNARKKAMDEFRFSIPHTEKFSKDSLDKLQDKYDVFICGSDQVFRPNKQSGELDDSFFLRMIDKGATKASYAASMGIQSYEPDTEKKAAVYLSSFDRISMREESSAEYIGRITGRNDVIVSVDPVFLIKREDWISRSKPYIIDGKYILVYMIHGTEKLYKTIKEFSRSRGLKIITFPSMSYKKKKYETNFADKEILDADPLQFISLLNNAEYIFTDSFHGTALSLILHKEAFVSKANEIAFSRIDNILKLTDAYDLVIPSEGLTPQSYVNKPEINWERADAAIEEQRKKSFSYLKEVIES